jgi:N-methylhydantoinase A
MMMSDLRRDLFVTNLVDLAKGAGAEIEGVFAETEAKAMATFIAEGVQTDKVSFLRYGKFRYQNQEHTTEVLLSNDTITDAALARIAEDFHEAYEREYTYRLDAPVEMVGIHLVAKAEVGKLEMRPEKLGGTDASSAIKGKRMVDYAQEGRHQAQIYDGEALCPGMAFNGPAVIEDSGSTIVVHPGNRVEIDAYRNTHISFSG